MLHINDLIFSFKANSIRMVFLYWFFKVEFKSGTSTQWRCLLLNALHKGVIWKYALVVKHLDYIKHKWHICGDLSERFYYECSHAITSLAVFYMNEKVVTEPKLLFSKEWPQRISCLKNTPLFWGWWKNFVKVVTKEKEEEAIIFLKNKFSWFCKAKIKEGLLLSHKFRLRIWN